MVRSLEQVRTGAGKAPRRRPPIEKLGACFWLGDVQGVKNESERQMPGPMLSAGLAMVHTVNNLTFLFAERVVHLLFQDFLAA